MSERPEGGAMVVCTGRRCGVRGWILALVARKWGWRVIRAECLRACQYRPVAIVYPPGRFYGRVTYQWLRGLGDESR